MCLVQGQFRIYLMAILELCSILAWSMLKQFMLGLCLVEHHSRIFVEAKFCWCNVRPMFDLCWVSERWIQTFRRKAHPSQSFLDLIESENSQDCGSSLHPSWSIFGGPVWFEPIWIDFGSIDLDTNHSRFSFQCISFKLFNLYIVLTRSYAFMNDSNSIKKIPAAGENWTLRLGETGWSQN